MAFEINWFFDAPLNLTVEQEGKAFLEKEGNIIVLILCDYPSGRVRATRAIRIALETMRRIKEACEQQTTTIAVNVAIDECYARVSLEQMIKEAIQ